MYFLSKDDHNCADTGNDAVESLGECKMAVAELRKKGYPHLQFWKELSNDELPTGCLWPDAITYSTNVYWNLDGQDSGSPYAQLICRKTGIGTLS